MIRKTTWTLVAVMALLVATAGLASAQITLQAWDWHAPRAELMNAKIAEYQELNPHVNIELTILPSQEYWTKALAGVAAGDPPDLIYFHNERLSAFLDVLEPFPEDLFPLDEMREKYIMFDQAFLLNGKMYFYPTGLMAGLLWYNPSLYEAAGMTDADVPQTWDELAAAAVKLTERDPMGNIDVSGFAFNNSFDSLFSALKFQSGGWSLSPDLRTVEWDKEPGIQAAQFVYDLIHEYQVTEPGFLNFNEAFGLQRSAQMFGWTWLGGWLRTNYEEFDWKVARMPTPTGSSLPALGANNYEAGHAVLKGVPDERREEVWRFLRWLYEDSDYLVHLSHVMGIAPGKIELLDHPAIAGDEMLRVLGETIPYTIFPGEVPAAWGDILSDAETRLMQGIPAEQTMRIAAQEANMYLMENPVRWVVEREYQPPAE